VVSAASAICCAAQGKDDYVDRSSGRSKDGIVRACDSVRIANQTLRILKRRSAERGIDVDGDASV
jgi:hypothetical protein